jgi:long-chain acyl-CoA synthetase
MVEGPLSIHEATAQLTAEGQLFETDQATVNGAEMTVWKHAPANLRDVLDLSLGHGDMDFLVYEDTRYSFDQHYRIVSTLAQRLLDAGVTKGDRVRSLLAIFQSG